MDTTNNNRHLWQDIKVAIRMFLYKIQFIIIKRQLNRITIQNSEQTIEYILKTQCSVCRYGDGEMDMIASLEYGYIDARKSDFQNFSKRLAERLQQVIESSTIELSDKNILICIPYVWKKPQILVQKSKMFVQRNFVNNHKIIFEVLNNKVLYGDSYFTRFYIDHKNKQKGDYINQCQKIWTKRDVCIIEGEQSRLGVGNDLFNNANSIERILCPAKNAFEKYDEILDLALEIDKSKLILIALGQTATVLAYDLAINGYQAIDIGHIDIEYEWFLMGTDKKVPIPHKYVNELKEGRIFTTENNSEYLAQIKNRII